LIKYIVFCSCLIVSAESLFAEGPPEHMFESGYSAGSGDYGKSVQRFSADNVFKVQKSPPAEDYDGNVSGNSEELFRIMTRVDYAKYWNSDKAILKQFSSANVMLGVKAGNNLVTGAVFSSHEYVRDTFDDSSYMISYAHGFQLGGGSEIEAGFGLTNAYHFGSYMKKHPMTPFPMPIFSYSRNVSSWFLKLGIINVAVWRKDKIMFQAMYSPLHKYSFSLRYNFFPFLYSELYSESVLNSVSSSKTDGSDKVNILSLYSGLRVGGYVSKNMSVSIGGGYCPYAREWIGSPTNINKGKRIDSSYSAEIKVSAFF
jgi:hypothetical protein